MSNFAHAASNARSSASEIRRSRCTSCLTLILTPRGYLKLENLVVRLYFPYLNVPSRYPAFVERRVTETTRPTMAAIPQKLVAPVIQSPVETLIAHERPPSPAVGQEPFFQ